MTSWLIMWTGPMHTTKWGFLRRIWIGASRPQAADPRHTSWIPKQCSDHRFWSELLASIHSCHFGTSGQSLAWTEGILCATVPSGTTRLAFSDSPLQFRLETFCSTPNPALTSRGCCNGTGFGRRPTLFQSPTHTIDTPISRFST
jgi:hypothetical protein